MKQMLIFLIFILFAVSLHAQDNCFDKCLESVEKSTLPFGEKQIQILQALVGCKAPDFIVQTIQGEVLNSNELRGNVVVINFWYEGCAPCIAELPALNKLRAEYQGKDVVFIAFSKDDTQ